MLELPKPVESKITTEQTNKEVSSDDSYLSFCIDVSGSMDTVIPVNGQASSTFTRLNGVKVACMETLKKLKEEEPYRRVNITTFSDTVSYFGDCTTNNAAPLLDIGGHSRFRQQQHHYKMTQVRGGPRYVIDDNLQQQAANQPDEVVSTPDDLENQERILTLANNLSGNVKGISESHSSIQNKINQLRTEGSTALGPALVFSIGFSSKKVGSSIILCTDGAANIGLGAIERDIGKRDR